MNKRKIEVVQHALVLFQQKGIMQTSIHDIIERSGISKGTFYNYFKSKNECIAAVIEHLRYEASLLRSDIQLGKSNDDISVLVEQIVQITARNHVYGLPSLFEQMLISSDNELKKYVMLYRIHEVWWFANRIVDIYGEEVRPYSFEAATLFYGMLNHVRFLKRVLFSSFIEEEVRTSVYSLISHIEPILNNMTNKQMAIFNQEQINKLLSPTKSQIIQKQDLIDELMQIKEQGRLTKFQNEITESIYEELDREEVRIAVLSALLPSFLNIYRGTDFQEQSRNIHMMISMYLSQQ